MSGRVAGKKALVTGAAQGLGAARAWRLAREGATVLLTDVNESGSRQVGEAIVAELGAGVAQRRLVRISSEAVTGRRRRRVAMSSVTSRRSEAGSWR
jgi:NAD(P)-dependent dehydrogenase (short-subunit alcohol dehydrogenase family)